MANPTITNVVVLMLENRSYDNVLGMLYNANNDEPYQKAPQGQSGLQGLTGTESNVDPAGGSITVAPAVNSPSSKPPVVATTIPTIDPGEPFADMAQQILGLESVDTTTNPYASTAPTTYGSMGGFVANYAAQSRSGTASVPAQIMMYMTPALMPVTAFLANNYMVCDEWFGSAPSHTFANRLFSVCASSGTWTADPQQNLAYSYIDDLEYVGLEHSAWPVFDAKSRLALSSVFAQLDAVLGVSQSRDDGPSFPSWKLYFHDYSITAGLLDYVYDQYADPTSMNVGQYDTTDYTSSTTHIANKNFTTFMDDIAAGTLAPFTLIEPRYSNNYSGALPGNEVQSNHPGLQAVVDFLDPSSPQIDTYYGELLLLDVYAQLRSSAYWESTLLIVVYDEHGGCYDHVKPSTMVPPTSTTPATFVGFDFTVSGPRVPAIIVSPFAGPGTTLRASGSVFDHASIIKTVWDIFGLDLGPNGLPQINDRDGAAASVLGGLSDTAVNTTGIPPTPAHP